MNKNLRVTILSMKDNGGGGGFTAAHRLFLAMLKNKQLVDMLVQIKNSNHPDIVSPINRKDKYRYFFRIIFTRAIFNIFGNKNNHDQTLALFNSGWSKKINYHSTDIINLHWIGGEMMSVSDIAKISKPLVWTLHDMWPFSGVSHITDANQIFYNSGEAKTKSFFDLELNAINRKKKLWTTPIHIVTPSNWLASQVKKSGVMKSWPVTVIPNIIDTSVFKPLSKAKCKKIFGINEKKKILLFGAFAGIVNENKGINLLLQALEGIPKSLSKNFELVIFGQEEPENFLYRRFNKIKWLGHISDEEKMCQLYNSSDIVLVPSRLEAFGLVAAEAQACGVPVVAFRCSGIKEVVSHMKTGYLANPYDPSDFASGIIWTIENSKILPSLARKKACEEWSPEVIVPKYLKLYKSVYENFNIS